MSLLAITKWNYDRNGLARDPKLEREMLDEEALEFKLGLIDFIRDDNLFKLEAMVEMIDAYCDFSFVYTGTIAKQISASDWIDEEKRMMYMNTYIIEGLFKHGVQIFDGNGKSVIDEANDAVIEANEAKPVKKTMHKVLKGDDWKDPKDLILDLLKARGWNDDTDAVADARAKDRANTNNGGTLEDFQAQFQEEEAPSE